MGELAKGSPKGAHAPTSGTQPIMSHLRPSRVAEVILRHIAIYVGPAIAQTAIVSSCHAVGCEPERAEMQDVPQILGALRPMLATLLGGASCRILLRRIERDLRL